MIAWWLDGTMLWDILWIGGELMPGLAAVDCDVARKIDVQVVKGSDGATMTDEGYEPQPIQIALKLWLKAHWIEWQRVLPIIHPRQVGGLRRPLEILHPSTESLGIETIYVRKISSPRGTGAKEPRIITLEALQWFPAPKAAKTSKKPKLGAVDPNDFDVPSPGTSGAVALNI